MNQELNENSAENREINHRHINTFFYTIRMELFTEIISYEQLTELADSMIVRGVILGNFMQSKQVYIYTGEPYEPEIE